MVIDVHTHAFPDHLAARAMAQLSAETDAIHAVLDGTLEDLLRSMDRAGIDVSVVASIATRPEQFDSILCWSEAIRNDRFEPFPSVHPAAADPAGDVRRIAEAGFHGLKLHPYYQRFVVDDPQLDPLYGAAEATGLVILLHSGFDLAFPRHRVADPRRVRSVLDRFPRLRVIAAHLGGWADWEEVERHLVGQPVWFDVSCSFDFMDSGQAGRLLRNHPAERLLFGSDSPWVDQLRTIQDLKSFGLGAAVERQVLGENAQGLLGRGTPPLAVLTLPAP